MYVHITASCCTTKRLGTNCKPMRVSVRIILSFLCVFSFSFCSNVKENKTDYLSVKFTVEEAPGWTALFKRYSGWFGADGIFAIPLNGKDNKQADSTTKTILIFSDTLIGEIEDGALTSGFDMVNNSVAFLTGNEPKENKISFEWAKDSANEPVSMFKPQIISSIGKEYYWLGDGFVNTALNNDIYVFAYRMRNLDPKDDWSFQKQGTSLIVIPSGSQPPFNNHKQVETPLDFAEGGFGAGVFVNTKESGSPKPDGYIYVYGVKDSIKNLVVARVLPEDFENFKLWTFWDGKSWNSDMNSVAVLASNVSNELSVSMLPDGRCVLVYQHGSMSPIIALRVAATPNSTFGEKKDVWHTQETTGNIFSYNAKAHPSLSAPGELLISYNVNAFDFKNEIVKDPNLYRPRFLKLKFQE